MTKKVAQGWECYAELRLLGFAESTVALSKRIGVQPTRYWRAGQRDRPGASPRTENGWVFRSPLGRDAEPAAHVAWLLDQLGNGVSRLVGPEGPGRACVSCVLYVESATPPMFLEADLVRRIADLGASFDVDLYLTRDEG